MNKKVHTVIFFWDEVGLGCHEKFSEQTLRSDYMISTFPKYKLAIKSVPRGKVSARID